MGQIIIDIPDAEAVRIRDAFVESYDYQPTLINAQGQTVPNPVTKNQFPTVKIIEYIKRVTANYEANIASEEAKQQVEAEIAAIPIT